MISNLRHNLRHSKTFFKKYTHAGSLVNTTLPACYIYHFTLQIYKSSAQNSFRAEDLYSIIIETCLYKATKSPQKSHKSPMVLPKLAAHLFPSYEKRVLAQSWRPQNTMMRLKNGNKPQILRLKSVFLTAKVIL